MRRALLAFLGLIGLYGCYDYTLPAPAENEANPKASPSGKKSSEGDPLNPTSSGSNTTPTNGDATVTPADATSSDAGSDASTATTGGECGPTGNFCGGSALLKCNADGTKTFLEKCANGCMNGTCNPPTTCVAGGTYCGGDKVNGDPDVLYKCGADGLATTVQQSCANGCMVAPAGQDDFCK